MNEYKIIKSSRSENGIISHVVDTCDSLPQEMQYVTVRGGLSWPNQGAPAYYIIFGQIHGGITRFQNDENRKKPVRFLREYADSDLIAFFKRLSEDIVLLSCQGLYVEKSEELKGYEASLEGFCKDERIEDRPYLYLEEASFADNFQYGATIIKEWLTRKDLILPEGTIIYSQLFCDGIRETDFSASDVAARFYAVNALRHVITALNFHDFGPSKPRRIRRRDGRVV